MKIVVKVLVLSILALFFLFSCTNKKSKIHYLGSKNLGNNFYAEFYEPYTGGAGVFSGSLTSAYITDSMKLNYFLGALEDDEDFEFYNDSSKIHVKKYRLVQHSFNEFPHKIYFDSMYFDIKTHKLIDK
jgi:hypothetical protein